MPHMEIRLDGWDLNIRFSAAHFLPAHNKCQRIHGHDYSVSAEIEGYNSTGFVADFLVVEKMLNEIVDNLDHRLILPNQSEILEWHESRNNIEISYNGKLVSVPKEFTVHIPVNSTSCEDLSNYLAERLMDQLKDEKNVKSLKLCLHEGPGRSACATRGK